MKQKKIKAIIKKKVTHIARLCAAIDTSFDKNLIHDFRVAVKSLRSFIRLQRSYTKDPRHKISKKFKHIYHIAGAIREAQLELDFFSKKSNLPYYINQLHLGLEVQKNEWKKHYSEKILRRLRKKLTGYKYKKMPPQVLNDFFNDRIVTMEGIGREIQPTDTQMHSVRKNIKDILYNAKIAGQEWKGTRPQLKLIPVKKLNDLSDMIGDYNDERIIKEHLNSFSSQAMGIDEKKKLKDFKNNEAKKLFADKKRVLAATKNYISGNEIKAPGSY